MGDEKTRRGALIVREILAGNMGKCEICGDLTSRREPERAPYEPRWICKPCQRMMADPGD